MYLSIHQLLLGGRIHLYISHVVGEIKFGDIFVTIPSLSHWRKFKPVKILAYMVYRQVLVYACACAGHTEMLKLCRIDRCICVYYVIVIVIPRPGLA